MRVDATAGAGASAKASQKTSKKNIPYLNETDEERRIRQNISRIILNHSVVEEIKTNYLTY
jgi:hypothetical protein